jgi:RuvB-like protein 2
LRVNFNFDFDL